MSEIEKKEVSYDSFYKSIGGADRKSNDIVRDDLKHVLSLIAGGWKIVSIIFGLPSDERSRGDVLSGDGDATRFSMYLSADGVDSMYVITPAVHRYSDSKQAPLDSVIKDAEVTEKVDLIPMVALVCGAALWQQNLVQANAT